MFISSALVVVFFNKHSVLSVSVLVKMWIN